MPGTHTVAELARLLSAEAVGDSSLPISGLAEPASARADQLAVALSNRFLADIPKGAARAAVLPAGQDWQALGLAAAVLVPAGRAAMAGLTAAFVEADTATTGVHPTAIVGEGCEIAEGTSVGPYAVIGAGARIGPGGRIAEHVSIAAGARIGAHADLRAGVRIGGGVHIGDNVFLHSGVVVGADGFSFATVDGVQVKIHSLGGVRIGNDVEIGANSSIDAGTIRATEIGDGTKIDALVQVGHNVRVGRNCLLCAHVAVGGSAELGDTVVLGGQVGVADNIRIGDRVIAGGATKILGSQPADTMLLGYPAVPMATHHEIYRALRRLPRLAAEVRRLGEVVSKSRRNG